MDHNEDDEILRRVNSHYAKWSTGDSAAIELARMDAKFQELQQLAKSGHVAANKQNESDTSAPASSSDLHAKLIMKKPEVRTAIPLTEDDFNRAFVRCCMSGCKSAFLSCTCFFHFMHRHLAGDQKKVFHTYENEPITIELPVKDRVLDKMGLLAILAFDGIKNGIRPGKRGIWVANDFLTEGDFQYSLPVLIFYVWTNSNDMTEGDAADLTDEKQNVLIIWAAVPPITKPLYYTLTVTGPDGNQKHTNIAAARRLNEDPQNANEFMNTASSNYLYLSVPNVKAMTKQFRENLRLEISIHEN